MYWMGDSNPDDPVGMQYIKNAIAPLFSNNATIDSISYYYFSWFAMSREREQKPESKSVWSAQSWNGFLMPGNNTEEIWTDIQSSLSAMFMYCKFVSPRVELWGGAISMISSDATVFPHRNAVYNVGIDLVVPTESDVDAASDEMHLVNAIWPSISRHLSGVYVNYPMASLSNNSYPTAYWGENLDRLVTLTERFDPSHILKVAQSVPTRTNYTISPTHF
jgi:FAD/FMN-containing dehydrogenase